MAASREPRRNAGNRMSRVLEEELEEDDFYKTTYGGFNEEEEDNDFRSDQEDSADEVDSDFDQSEHDEPISDGEESDKPKRKKKGVSTKAYKEPSTKKAKITSDNKTEVKTETNAKKRAITTPLDLPMRKSSRRATAANSVLTVMRQKEREEAEKKKKETVKKPTPGVRRLTQEELMAVAEKTERKNLKSLANYQRLEANRKKVSVKKRTFNEPTISYFSTAMPASDKVDTQSVKTANGINKDKVSRTFLIFSEDSVYKQTFYHKKLKPPSKMYCPVTKKQAKYFDPLTKLPYFDLNAFKVIRKTYTEVLQETKKL